VRIENGALPAGKVAYPILCSGNWNQDCLGKGAGARSWIQWRICCQSTEDGAEEGGEDGGRGRRCGVRNADSRPIPEPVRTAFRPVPVLAGDPGSLQTANQAISDGTRCGGRLKGRSAPWERDEYVL
jgi:hypothetical protein